MLVGTDLIAVFLLVAFQVFNLLALDLEGFLRFGHFFQGLALFLLFQLQNNLKPL